MEVFRSVSPKHPFFRKQCAITMGNYDGVHLGHRAILKILKLEAKKRGLPAVLYTFNPHPVKLLAPKIAPPLLNTLEQKLELLEECGLDAVVLEKFTPQFAHHSPEAFFKKYVVERLNARFIVVGYDFTFGARRSGNIETLERLCFERRMDCRIVDARLKGNILVSSSLIRKYLADGKTKEVAPLLIRPYFIDGKVIRGKGRGKLLGIHTANLKSDNELILKEGVYASRVRLGERVYPSVTNIGTNPTFGNARISIETHLFGFKGNAYARRIRLYFLDRIRDEIKFNSPKQLVDRIRRDIKQAKTILKRSRF